MLTMFGYPMAFCLVYLFIIGAVVGSFLNVCIYRIPTEERLLKSLHGIVSPRSRCPRCRNGIPPWANVPILGWLILRGRCFHCRMWISPRYPLIELGNGLLWALVYWMHIPDGYAATIDESWVHGRFGPTGDIDSWLLPASWLSERAVLHWQFFYHIVMIQALVVASFIDIDSRQIPDASTLPAMAVGVLGGGLIAQVHLTPVYHQSLRTTRDVRFLLPEEWHWLLLDGVFPSWIENWPHLHGLVNSLAGLVIAGGAVWGIRLIGFWAYRREAMGFGDVILLAMIGCFIGWQAAIIAFFMGAFLALTVTVLTWVFKRNRELPFGPYLGLGALGAVIFWKPVWNSSEAIFGSGPILILTVMIMAVGFALIMRLMNVVMTSLGFGGDGPEEEWVGEWTSADHLFHFSGETVDPRQGNWPVADWPGNNAGRGWTQYDTWRNGPR